MDEKRREDEVLAVDVHEFWPLAHCRRPYIDGKRHGRRLPALFHTSVIIDRALPDVRDGMQFKPVHRAHFVRYE